MTKKIHVHLIDDLDASEASETLRFEVDGRPYEIDLSSHNAQKFRAEIAPYIRHARRVVTHVRRRGPGRKRPGPPIRRCPGGPTERCHRQRRGRSDPRRRRVSRPWPGRRRPLTTRIPPATWPRGTRPGQDSAMRGTPVLTVPDTPAGQA